MLLLMSVRLAAALHGFLRTYMPTNILVRHLRARRCLRWSIPTALVMVSAYVFAASVTTTLIERGGPRLAQRPGVAAHLECDEVCRPWRMVRCTAGGDYSAGCASACALRRPISSLHQVCGSSRSVRSEATSFELGVHSGRGSALGLMTGPGDRSG